MSSDEDDEDEYLTHSHTDEPMLDITTHPNQRRITTLILKTYKQC